LLSRKGVKKNKEKWVGFTYERNADKARRGEKSRGEKKNETAFSQNTSG